MVKLNKIYTRTGDGGSAGLVDGSRVSKSSLRMAAIGDVDEANAAIGVAIAAVGAASSRTGCCASRTTCSISAPTSRRRAKSTARCASSRRQVERLEREIDAMNAVARAAHQLHPAERLRGRRRAAPRPRDRPPRRAGGGRAERGEPLNPQLLAYLNRLSDHLFVAARATSRQDEGGDVLWQPGATRG